MFMVYNFRQLLTGQLAHEFETKVFPQTPPPSGKERTIVERTLNVRPNVRPNVRRNDVEEC